MHRAARAYVERFGWPVLALHSVAEGRCSCGDARCRTPGKHPRTPRGVHDATTDLGTVDAMWSRWPAANVAVATGGDRLVLDVDPRNGGDETLHRLEREHGALPETPTALTGGGGQHVVLRVPEALSFPGALGAGVDVKGAGGYIVAPPSVHASGRRYAWDAACHPLEVPVADAPEWILAVAHGARRRAYGPPVSKAADSFLGVAFAALGWLVADLHGDRVAVRCPWAHEHSDHDPDARGDRVDSSTVLLPPTTERRLGAWRCLHGHCAHRRTDDVLAVLPPEAIDAAAKKFPDAWRSVVVRLARRPKT